MDDRYVKMMRWSINRSIAKRLGLPQPVTLQRYSEGNDFLIGNTLVGSSNGGIFFENIFELLGQGRQTLYTEQNYEQGSQLKTVVFDASGIATAQETSVLCDFFGKYVRSFGHCARIVMVGLLPDACPSRQGTAQRALLGFVKSFAKEMRAGCTVNLLWCHPECGASIGAPLAFFCSDRSAYVSGQFLTVFPSAENSLDFHLPLAGKNVLVTGAARGIGRAISQLLSHRGATVTLVDMPGSENNLQSLASELNGTYLPLDITTPEAAEKIIEHFQSRPLYGLVHNAGITRDRKLANMTRDRWEAVIRTNWSCPEEINQALIDRGVLTSGSRIVLVSSISGIGGNAGQTNYATSKAAVIGMVESYAPEYDEKGITINAVAPGFIETQMVKTIPIALREAGRRLNSMAQGGQPADVAESICLFLQPSARGVQGNVLRVCGQAIMGA